MASVLLNAFPEVSVDAVVEVTLAGEVPVELLPQLQRKAQEKISAMLRANRFQYVPKIKVDINSLPSAR